MIMNNGLFISILQAILPFKESRKRIREKSRDHPDFILDEICFLGFEVIERVWSVFIKFLVLFFETGDFLYGFVEGFELDVFCVVMQIHFFLNLNLRNSICEILSKLIL